MRKLTVFARSCVATPLNLALTLLTLLLLAWTLPELIAWSLLDAVWRGDSARACEGHDAACWVFVRIRLGQLIYGPYPAAERWRIDLVALLAVLAVGVVFATRSLTGLLALWTIATALPVGLLLALGRRSTMPVIGYACAIFIELWRSLPLIGVLFLAVVMFPLFAPPGFESDRLVRALIAFTLFNAAIFAEVFRGGLQAIPAGQREAARSLGLGYWRMTLLVELPQVVRIVMPGMINACVSIIKETTVVLVIGLIEFLAVLQIAFADPDWLIGDQVRSTGYLFAALVFWSLCFGLSRYSARLDRQMRAA